MQFLLIHPGQSVQDAEKVFIEPGPNALRKLQDYIGGRVEMVLSANQEYTIILNEEGKLMGLPINYVGTSLHGDENDLIVGTILVADTQEFFEWDKSL